jgi:hypothetical protein
MFSDRWWLLKAACALLLLAAVCTASRTLLIDRHPELERVAYFTEDLRTKTLSLTGRKVMTADAAGFEIGSSVAPIRVLTPNPPPAGVYVSFIGRPVGPRTLTTSAVQINAGWAWKRPLNYAVSILVVIGYLWAVRRRFRWRIEDGVFRGKY